MLTEELASRLARVALANIVREYPRHIQHFMSTAGEELVYQHLKLPVIKDRDFTLRVRWTEGKARGITFSIDSAHGPAATKKAVRLSTLTGRWDLEPIRDGNATRAVYHVQIDFAGSVPHWMVSGGAGKDIPGVFVGMRRLPGDVVCSVGYVSA